MHLGLDDIDATRTAVLELAETAQIIERDRRGHDRVENALGRLAAIGEVDRRRRHQMADIAHEQQRATG